CGSAAAAAFRPGAVPAPGRRLAADRRPTGTMRLTWALHGAASRWRRRRRAGYCEPVRQTTGFARLPGGPRIAFAVVGSGPALVLPAWWVSNVVEDWHFGPLRRFIEGLAAGRTVVRYDRLATGLSDRDRPAETFTKD